MSVDLSAIRARLAAATPGLWEAGDARDDDGWAVISNVGDGDDEVCVMPRSRLGDEFSGADADLIAHAPADLAALCDEVERLRAIIAEREPSDPAQCPAAVRFIGRDEPCRCPCHEGAP